MNLFKGSWRDHFSETSYSYVLADSAGRVQANVANENNGHIGNVKQGAPLTLSIEEIIAKEYSDREGVIRMIAEGSSPCETLPESCFITVKAFDEIEGERVLLGQSKIWIDLRDVKSFYDHFTAGNVDRDSLASGAIDPIQPHEVREDRRGFPERLSIYDGTVEAEIISSDYILFVHGWRMTYPEKLSFAETAFKRLYWSGYRGEFGVFTWPTGWFDKPAHKYGLAALPYVINNEQNYGKSESVGFYPVKADTSKKRHTMPKECS